MEKFFTFSRGFFAFVLLLLLNSITFSCSVMSREQLDTVEKFGNSCDSFKRYPSLFFREIACLRMERGLFYAATLEEPQNRMDELAEIGRAYDSDMKLAAKTDKSLEILRSYSRALRVLVAKGRWESRGREFRSLGRALDSLVLEANRLQLFKEQLPEGFAKSAGVVVAYGAEKMLQNRQHKLARSFVCQADTLVGALAAQLVELLRMPQVSAMIEHEKQSLETNYGSYLRNSGVDGSRPVSLESDRRFLELHNRANKLATTRGYVISATNRLAKSHNNIAMALEKGKGVQEVYDSLLEFAESVSKLEKEFKNQ
jgi:hypothetical protein